MAAWHLKNDFTKVTIQKSQKHIDAFVCQVAGPKKTPFCVHEDELLWAADELLAEERQTHPVVLSHDDLNVTTVASSGGSIGEGAVEAIAATRQSENGLWRVFFW